MVIQTLDPLELKRRVSGVKFTELSQRTGISYRRIWRFFKEHGTLTRLEMASVESALDNTTGGVERDGGEPSTQERASSPSVTPEARS